MMHCYLCTVKAGNLVLKEHESARWLFADELYGVEWLPADIEVIRKLENILRAL